MRLGLGRIAVDRTYRLLAEGTADAACYLQGVNEATHGIADSLLSMLATRAGDITENILAHRAGSSCHRPTFGSLSGIVSYASNPTSPTFPS